MPRMHQVDALLTRAPSTHPDGAAGSGILAGCRLAAGQPVVVERSGICSFVGSVCRAPMRWMQ